MPTNNKMGDRDTNNTNLGEDSVIIQGDHHNLCDKFDMSFTKDWDLIKIFPWRFSGIMDGLFLYHHQNTQSR